MHPDQIAAALVRIENEVCAIKSLIDGGSEPATGLLIRVDRMEQDSLRTKATAAQARGLGWTALGTMAAGAGVWLWRSITGHNP